MDDIDPSNFANKHLLTPVLNISTTVPAPDRTVSSVNGDIQKVSKDGDLTVMVNACSEFTSETLPLNTFSGTHKLRLAHDHSGAPMIFTIGSNKKLYCTVHVDGAPQGYQAINITLDSPSNIVTAFDVLQTIDGHLIIAAAHQDSSKVARIYYATIPVPNCLWDAKSRQVTGLGPQIPWQRVAEVPGNRVSYVTLSPSPKEDFQLAVGTFADDYLTAGHYLLDYNVNSEAYWREVSVPESSSKILEICAANLWEGTGLFTLYERFDKTVGCTFDSSDSKFHYRLQTEVTGTPRSIFANANPWNMTDILIASSRGVGFYNFSAPDQSPQVVLPELSFKQVVSSEAVDPENPKSQTKLIIFAVTDEGDLYHIVGSRPFNTNIVDFVYSGVPIVTEVEMISTQYNATHSANEIIYVGSENNEINHLWLDSGNIWLHNRILVKGASGVTRTPVYITSLMFTNSDGRSLGGEYPVLINSTLVHASVNGRSRIISGKPTIFLTDSKGCIKISVAVNETLAGPKYKITLATLTDTPQSFTIDSSQRVLRMLGNIKNADHLANAKSTTGQPVFKLSADQLSDTSNILAQFPSMLDSVDESSAKANLDHPPSSFPEKFQTSYSIDSNGNVTHDSGEWILDFVDGIGHVFADIIQWLKAKAKAVVRFAIQIAGKIVNFVFKIAGKVIRFWVKQVGQLLAGVSNFLRDYLGLNMSGLENWLSFIFDNGKAEATQKLLLKFADNMKLTTKEALGGGRKIISDGIEDVHDTLETYVNDNRKPIFHNRDSFSSNYKKPNRTFDFFFHNPIVTQLARFNPLSIAIEAITEGVEEELVAMGIGVPMLDLEGIYNVMAKFLEDEWNNLSGLLEDLKDKFSAVAGDPGRLTQSLSELFGDTLWAIFDSLKILVLGIYDAMAAALDSIFDVINGTYKLGFISELWEEFSGTPLTIMNVFTFIAAHALNLYTLIAHDKLPIELWGDPNVIFNAKSDPQPHERVLHVPPLSLPVEGNIEFISKLGIATADISTSAHKIEVSNKEDAPIAMTSANTTTTTISATADQDSVITMGLNQNQFDVLMDWMTLIAQCACCGASFIGFVDAITEVQESIEQDQQNFELIKRGYSDPDERTMLLPATVDPPDEEKARTERKANLKEAIHFFFDGILISSRTVVILFTEARLHNDPDFEKSYKDLGLRRALRIAGWVAAVSDCGARIYKFKHPSKRSSGVAEATNAILCSLNLVDSIISVTSSTSEMDKTYSGLCIAGSFLGGISSSTQAAMLFSGKRGSIITVGCGIFNVLDVALAVVATAIVCVQTGPKLGRALHH